MLNGYRCALTTFLMTTLFQPGGGSPYIWYTAGVPSLLMIPWVSINPASVV